MRSPATRLQLAGSSPGFSALCHDGTCCIDNEQTLADTVEGLTDIHEILASIIRAFLADEALASGLKGRIAEMETRLGRLQDRAAKPPP